MDGKQEADVRCWSGPSTVDRLEPGPRLLRKEEHPLNQRVRFSALERGGRGPEQQTPNVPAVVWEAMLWFFTGVPGNTKWLVAPASAIAMSTAILMPLT